MTCFGVLNLECLLIVAISVIMSSFNFIFSRVEHEKTFVTSEPGQGRCGCAGKFAFLLFAYAPIRYSLMIHLLSISIE